MREGNLEAPTRKPLAWRDADFYDEAKLDAELRRVFDICHTCRRCFNLCDSFPRLFDLVDAAGDAEVAGVSSKDFRKVVDACTLCDMCFMTKCPYVPPHPFDVDFPHLMLRYRAVQFQKKEVGFVDRQLAETDRNGRLASAVAPVANWATERGNSLTRPLMEKIARVHREAPLPRYHGRTLTARAKTAPEVNRAAPAFGRKAVLFATCFGNFNEPDIGTAARAVLAHNGVQTEVVHPGCCGMPQLEHGDLARVAAQAEQISAALAPWIADGFDVIAMVASCALMLKFEWSLLLPENPAVQRLSRATFDIAEYVVGIARKEGLVEGLMPLDGGVAIHLACHTRAQNVGAKAVEMLRLIPNTEIEVIERCSGHGGTWGIHKENYEVALRVGKPTVRQAARAGLRHLVSECPLAAMHLKDGLDRLQEDKPAIDKVRHPIELVARSYGLCGRARMARTEITRADLMPLDEYGRQRADIRRRMVEMKRSRRMAVGPHAMLIFENWDTMWFQIHEMLFIERGGEQQIADELHAYGPLVPNGRELVATLMIEVEDEARRRRLLAGLGGIENRVALLIGDERIAAVAEMDVERTDVSGKASSVHFLHFPFGDSEIAAFRDTATRVLAAIDHPQYGHLAVVPNDIRRNLAADFA